LAKQPRGLRSIPWRAQRGSRRHSAGTSRRRARGPRTPALVALLDELRSGRPTDEAIVAAEIARVRLLYDNVLRERYDKAEPRLADLDQLQHIAAGYPDRATFLSALALEPPQATQDLASGGGDEEDDYLVLSTAHSAKGKEWDAVFVIWAVDGWFPSARCLKTPEETDEERRLMYVAMTRARNHLSIVYPLNAYSTRRGSGLLAGPALPFHRSRSARQNGDA
jgi:DNA helicase-2/ATP-dependent DNA helicase PcrA